MASNKNGLPPTEKRGWMKKTARGGTGLFGTWQNRYFVLGDGVIRYYARDKDATSPDNQKGEMSLINTTVVTVAGSSTQIQILAGTAD
eukprot:gene41655-55234_t